MTEGSKPKGFIVFFAGFHVFFFFKIDLKRFLVCFFFHFKGFFILFEEFFQWF